MKLLYKLLINIFIEETFYLYLYFNRICIQINLFTYGIV